VPAFQTQDLNSLWIVKLGGSIISTEHSQDLFNKETLKLVAGYLKNLDRPLIVVHGTGYISKEFARRHQMLNGKIEGRRKQTVTDCLLMLREIHFSVLSTFVEEGIRAISISPFSFCASRDGTIELLYPELLRRVLRGGFVPLLHGDLIVDKRGDYLVCSSDALVASLAKQLSADKLLFATDVPGVHREDPKKSPDSECFDYLSPDALRMLAQLPNDGNDVSGAMPAKLRAIQQVTDYFRECYIFEGRLPESWHKLIHLEEPTGTLISGGNRRYQVEIEREAEN
jgi:isopentenyl phosphate kinase